VLDPTTGLPVAIPRPNPPSPPWIDESFEVTLRNHKKESVEIRVVEHLYRWVNWEINRNPATTEKPTRRLSSFQSNSNRTANRQLVIPSIIRGDSRELRPLSSSDKLLFMRKAYAKQNKWRREWRAAMPAAARPLNLGAY